MFKKEVKRQSKKEIRGNRLIKRETNEGRVTEKERKRMIKSGEERKRGGEKDKNL